jgi:hypothetical protein
MSTILDPHRPINPAADPEDVYPFTLQDLRWAAETFNAGCQGYDVEPDDFALDPIDDAEAAEVVRHLNAEEAFDPSEPDVDGLDFWDAEPDYDALANHFEEQELAEAGILPVSRASFPGHDDRPAIRDECLAVVRAETFRLTGERISPAEAGGRHDDAWARTRSGR